MATTATTTSPDANKVSTTTYARPFIDIILTTTISQTTLNGYVGFDTITQQIEKKLLKRGFQFNVMVVGNVNCFLFVAMACLAHPFVLSLSLSLGHLATQVRRVSASRHWSIPSSPRISLIARVVSKQQSLHVKPQRLSKSLTVSTGFSIMSLNSTHHLLCSCYSYPNASD